MKPRLIVILFMLLSVGAFSQTSKPTDYTPLKQRSTFKNPKVDHSSFEILKQKFKTPQELTQACLTCHTESAKEMMKTAHWNWERPAYIKGRGVTYLGKRNLINNFCTSIAGSEGTCTRCHIGYGYDSKDYNFNNQANVDCMVCHDLSGIYQKMPGGAGYPYPDVDLSAAAQSVGIPQKENCGYCHFHSAGGNNIKNGSLDNALLNTTRDVDVHMAKNGPDLACVECHKTVNHLVKGKYYGVSSMNKNRVSCTQCHSSSPHKSNIINEHTSKIACQTCHIPVVAKVNPTKIYWDWSTATKLDENGKPFSIENELGTDEYLSIKGNFIWKKNLKPDYIFFNGTANHHLLKDKINDTIVKINTLYGSYDDPNSKICPVKIHRGKQPWDPVNKTIAVFKLWDKEKGKGALWKDFNFSTAIKAGMAYAQLPYSGKFDFIKTEMTLPLNHMVSPADKALTCAECHTRNDGRLAKLGGFYMPGRDKNDWIDNLGALLIIVSLLVVVVHGTIRYIATKKRNHAAN